MLSVSQFHALIWFEIFEANPMRFRILRATFTPQQAYLGILLKHIRECIAIAYDACLCYWYAKRVLDLESRIVDFGII